MRMSTGRLALLALVITGVASGCGDDTRVGGGGSPGDGTSEATGDAASTTAADSASVATSSAVAVSASASTGEPEMCAWLGDDPGGLVATGAAVGDVIENVTGLIDQCGVSRSLWDFAGGYRILSITTGW